MLTILRNFRTMFMLTVAQSLDAAVDAFDTTDDNQLDATETQALLESAEAKNIVGLAEVDTLDASVDLAGNIDFSNGIDKFEQQTIQYLATKIQKLTGGNVEDGSIDGNIGRGSRADIASASGIVINSNDDINQAVLNALVSKASNVATVKRAEFVLAAQEAAVATQEAATERQSNLQIVAGFDWENKTNASQDEIKALQQALQDLGKPVNTIDGVITPGGATEREYNAIQGEIESMAYSDAEERLSEANQRLIDAQELVESAREVDERDGRPGLAESLEREVDVESMRQRIAEGRLETIQQERAIEADVYARINIEGEVNADSVKAALEADPEGKKLLCQLQADLKILKNSNGNSYYTSSIDGKFGPGTTRAVNGAIEQYGSLTAIRRAARLAEVVIEAERNNSDGRTNQGLDIVAQTEGYEAGNLEAFLAEYKVSDSMPENIKQGTPEEQRAWCIREAIRQGDREDAHNDRRITFIDGLSQHGNDRLSDVMPELRKNFETLSGISDLLGAMTQGIDLDASDFVNGEVGAENYEALQFGDLIIDSGTLDSAYIACNNELTTDIDGSRQRGTLEVPIYNADGIINEKFAELEFANAVYINGALVMTVKNGCEGNLVIIPIKRDKYVPPVITRVPNIEIDTPAAADLPPYSGLEVNCNGVQVPGTRVMSYNGYEVYLAEGRIFRVKNDIVESRSFGLNEGVAYKPLTANMVRDNIQDIMQSGTIGIGSIRLANLWNHVGSTQNVCPPTPTDGGDGTSGTPLVGKVLTTPGVEGGGDEGGGGTGGGNDGGRT